MDAGSFDRLTQRAARGLSRRATALSLAAAGLAGAGVGVDMNMADAKHNKNRCKKQTDQCISFFTPGCGKNPDCLAAVDRCCPIIGRCDFNGFFDCIQVA